MQPSQPLPPSSLSQYRSTIPWPCHEIENVRKPKSWEVLPHGVHAGWNASPDSRCSRRRVHHALHETTCQTLAPALWIRVHGYNPRVIHSRRT